MPRQYFTLVESVDHGATWQPHFGDYDKECVNDELTEYQYNARNQGIKAKYKIVVSNDDQASIDNAVNSLNKKGC